VPNIYLYAANNPSESILAKRRGYGTIVSHNVPAYSRAGLYKDLAQLKELLGEYREQPEANAGLRPVVAGVLERTGLYEDCPFEEAPTAAPGKLSAEEAERVAPAAFDTYATRLTSYLGVLEARLFSEGLHVLGEPPAAPQLLQYLDAYFDGQLPSAVLEAVATLDTPADAEPRLLLPRLLKALGATPGLAESLGDLSEPTGPGAGYNWYESLSSEEKYEMELWPLDLLRFYILKIRRALGDKEAGRLIEEEVAVAFGPAQDEGMLQGKKTARVAAEEAAAQRATTRGRLLEALEIKQLLEKNTEETASICKALNGEYVLPGVGGDLLRDGTGVLPTGRNIHALDPYRLPSPAAWQRGQEAARKILEQHQAANQGAYPETVAVMLWGLDAIKTRGESVAILLALVGARPVKEATGRIVKYELVPLEELGRPRVDVLASLSGIFRDSFANVVRVCV
jgi:magnesium chelatase subunit H